MSQSQYIQNQATTHDIPMVTTENINERHYGSLQGLNKEEAKNQYGENQIKQWRRGYDTSPPNGESLEQTVERVNNTFKNIILPTLKDNKNCLVVSHGNALRALCLLIENISPENIVSLEIPLAEPIVYQFSNHQLTKD